MISPSVARQLAKVGQVNFAHLLEMQFASVTLRLHTGVGPLVAGERQWHGAGDLLEIPPVGYQSGLVADERVYTLAVRLPELWEAVRLSGTEVVDRLCTEYLYFMHTDGSGGAPPVVLFRGFMDFMSVSVSAETEYIALPVRSPLARRGVSVAGIWSDQEFRRIDPTDRAGEAVGTERSTPWPDF